MTRVLAAVFVGGALGSVLRALVEHALPSTELPWGTLLVNFVGAALLGLLVGGLQSGWPHWLRQGSTTGMLGGFTTYSALVLWLAQHAAAAVGAAVSLATAVAGVLAASAGLWAGERLRRPEMPLPAPGRGER